MLCLHGFPDHAQSWAHFLDRLAQDGYWAVAPALRGYWAGGAAPDGSYRALATGQDVLALITWGCRRVAAAGKTAEYLEELAHADYGRPLHVQRGPHATGARS